jgi:elongation factor G
MIEEIADYSDALMETYLEGGHVTRDEIRHALRQGTLRCAMHPVLCGSALKNRGVRSLLDAICDYLPSPHDLEPLTGTAGPKDDTEVVRKHDQNEPFSGLAFKTVSDPNGDLTFVRVYSGVLKRSDEVLNVRTGKKERIGRLLRMHADNREAMDQIRAGDICAVIGLKNTITGDTLSDKNETILLESMEFPDTVISMSIAPEARGDRDKLGEALARLAKEDPTFRRFTDEETEETIIAGMGELHLEIIASRLAREFKVPVVTGKPRVAYRQTLAKPIEIEGKHVKQTGGSGQFGVVKVKFESDPESAEFEFESKIVGGSVPKEYIPAVGDGIKKYCEEGGDLRLPIVGVKASLVDGKSHDVDSSELAFRAAGRLAIRGAMEKAGSTILEPLMKVEVQTPDEFVGTVIGDLNSRRMQIDEIAQGPGDIRIVRGKVPIAETFQYSTTLRSLTQGRATFSMEPSEYMPVPRSLQEVIVKEQLARRKK